MCCDRAVDELSFWPNKGFNGVSALQCFKRIVGEFSRANVSIHSSFHREGNKTKEFHAGISVSFSFFETQINRMPGTTVCGPDSEVAQCGKEEFLLIHKLRQKRAWLFTGDVWWLIAINLHSDQLAVYRLVVPLW